MGRLVFFNMMSLDGFFSRPRGELDWHQVDEEFVDFAIEQLDSAGLLLFGRRTFEFMAGFWTSPEAIKEDPETARRMNSLPKIVFSSGLANAVWSNSRILRSVDKAELGSLLREEKKDAFLFGSGLLGQSLDKLDLIDEYRVMLNPVLLGAGRPLFEGYRQRRLELVRTRSFRNGNLLLAYRPIRG